MWASSLALNGLTGRGKQGVWSCHPMEHELSAFYDITRDWLSNFNASLDELRFV